MTEKSKPRLLIIDDMQSVRAMVKVLAASVGCEIAGEAENGAEGLEVYKQERPDLTLLDIEMPVKNGIETLKAILKFDQDAQVVMLTAVDNTMVAEDCILSGAKDYLRKDLNPEDMKKRLQEEVNKITKN